MNVLILSNPDHQDFISTVVEKNRRHSFFIYWQSSRFEFVQPFSYDIGISFMYQHKVPAKELSHTWINFHPGPLPEYKGRNLCYHAIMNGAKRFGASVHYMDEDFDTGDIIDAWKFDIEPSWTAQDLHDRTMYESELMFKHFFPRIISGDDFIRLPNVGGTYYKKEPIPDEINFIKGSIADHVKSQVRAITYGSFYPKIDIGGVTYKIARDE
jgi:methionyl-tRNA formyltransferase